MTGFPPTPAPRLCMFPECTAAACFGFSPSGFSWRDPSPDTDAAPGATSFETETVWTCGHHKQDAQGLIDARRAARTQRDRDRFKPAQGNLW
jgi:hypothetical protein